MKNLSIREFSENLLNKSFEEIYDSIMDELGDSEFESEAFKIIYDNMGLDESMEFIQYISDRRSQYESLMEKAERINPIEDNQQDIIREIRESLKIKIPSRGNSLKFNKERLILHISYWIYLHNQGGKYSKDLMKSWEMESPEEILRESGINPNLIPNF